MPDRDKPVTSSETTMTVKMPRELADAFDRACAARDITKSQAVREMIRDFLNKTKQPRLPL